MYARQVPLSISLRIDDVASVFTTIADIGVRRYEYSGGDATECWPESHRASVCDANAAER